MKLLGSAECKITRDKNGENVPHLEVVELVLVHSILLIMIISLIQEYYIILYQTRYSVVY